MQAAVGHAQKWMHKRIVRKTSTTSTGVTCNWTMILSLLLALYYRFLTSYASKTQNIRLAHLLKTPHILASDWLSNDYPCQHLKNQTWSNRVCHDIVFKKQQIIALYIKRNQILKNQNMRTYISTSEKSSPPLTSFKLCSSSHRGPKQLSC